MIFPLDHQHFGVTPFNPELGTTITKEDFNLEQRILKWKRAWEKDKQKEREGKSFFEPKSPLALNLRSSIYDLHDMGLCDEIRKPMGVGYVIKPEVLEKIKNIYLSLTFPLSSWVSESDNPQKDGLSFYYFYPSNTGPLANNPEAPWAQGGALHKGVTIFVPAELNKLSQIKGKFLTFITN